MANHHPQDAVVINHILKSMGVEDFEPRVINQLLDFKYRYITDVLLDAEVISQHSGKPVGVVEMEDVLLAVRSRAAVSFMQPPSQELVAELAESVNKMPLAKPSKEKPGLLLPPEDDCLLHPNYQYKGPDVPTN